MRGRGRRARLIGKGWRAGRGEGARPRRLACLGLLFRDGTGAHRSERAAVEPALCLLPLAEQVPLVESDLGEC
jgi:hypothetical protein